jgi:hypothetical protein
MILGLEEGSKVLVITDFYIGTTFENTEVLLL